MKKKNLEEKEFLFRKKNYSVLFIALAFIAFGFILMIGGGSQDPNVFRPEIFNFRRIRIAPTLVLIGFGLIIYSIFIKTSNKKKG